MERSIQVLMAIQCLILGLSHVFQSAAWVEFFVWLRSQGRTGVFLNGLLSLTIGSLIVAFHNVWQGLPVILTVFGWAQVLKASVGLILPSVSMRSFARVSADRSVEFVGAGAVLLVLSALFCWMAVTG
ncbi:MAG TPA: hypothetical protein VM165_08360 [Planctomycetaceae bacterium]|nr:hypothetical protein [Planctomycetaceae bacterium]